MSEFFLVSLGAIFGANARFIIFRKFEKLNLNKYYSTLLINTLSSFFLGVFLSFLEKISSFIYIYQLGLFFSIGFLGSFSTFSTFVANLYDLFLQLRFSMALILFTISSSLGIISFAFGFLLGNQ